MSESSNESGSRELPKQYRPAEFEPGILSRWLASGAFHADPAAVKSGRKRGYSVLIPPPNVTAALHLGHALNNTLQDVLVRAKRMQGYETLWMPGTDHAGIATQTVVDKRLRAEGKPALVEHKQMEAAGENGRERFVELVQAFKDEYEARITDQLLKMGCSCDFDRQRFTMDEICARAVREAFFRLFRDGLIYRGKRLVNWDPVTQTALADDEVENEEVESSFWYMKYPVVDAAGEPTGEHVTVATTRPETFFGDTGVAVNPNDPDRARFAGQRVKLPFVGRVIPIVADDYVVAPDPESSDSKAKYASGFLKVTPAHDPNDWDLGQRHSLDIVNVMAPDASISEQHGWEDVGDAGWAVGLSREDARAEVEKRFRDAGLLADKKPYSHSVGHSYRSHAIVEPYLSDQWYVRVTDDRLRGSALRSMSPDQRTTDGFRASSADRTSEEPGDGALRFVPSRYAKSFETWHENLRDWCISRQLWWGHRIPVWTISNKILVEDGHLDTLERKFKGAFHCITSEGERDEQIATICAQPNEELEAFLESIGAAQDPDVLDTWFSSALWPLSTMGWPNHAIQAPDARVLLPEAPGSLRSIYVKRVNTWSEFVGKADEFSGDLIDRLIFLREKDADKLVYQLFSAKDLSLPLYTPDEIQECEDLVCAVGLKQHGEVETAKFGSMHLDDWLLSHGFVSTADLLGAFNPTSVLSTARDIITLWVSRMVMFNRYFLSDAASNDRGGPAGDALGPIPFRDVYIHALLQDGDGRKMSKSLGNGVDPLDIIDSHGCDAMRFTLCKMTTQTQDVRLPVEHDAATGKNTSPKFDEGRNFCNTLWNAARFTLSILDRAGPEDAGGQPVSPGELPLLDRWMLSRLTQSARSIEGSLDRYDYAPYADSMYDLLWRDFCDWYLEASKPTIDSSPAQRAVLRNAMETILRLLHPVCPFITEAIAEGLADRRTAAVAGLTLGEPEKAGLLCTAAWPSCDESLVDEDAEARFDRVRGLVEAVRQVRAQHQVKPKQRLTLHTDAPTLALVDEAAEATRFLAGLEAVTTDAPAADAVKFTFAGGDHFLSGLAAGVDKDAERARLTDLVSKLESDISKIEGRLSNPGYTEKAPEHLVNQTRQQLAEKQEERDRTRQALEGLG
ncbi:MAG: valine--tRNA ligase [Planctomycetota bacterium]